MYGYTAGPQILQNQDEEKATYAHKISTVSRKINFQNSSTDIINFIRAHSPKPGAWFFLKNERINIGIVTPIHLESITNKITNREINKKGI